jgi:glycosyltransferase involved in cell wall biosynthesis
MYLTGRGLGSACQICPDASGPVQKEIPPKQTIAYLTSQYARAGDTFIRAEVAELRKLGFNVHTFSIRAPVGGESIANDEIRRERENTEDLLSAGFLRLFSATLSLVSFRPVRFARALRLALSISTGGLRGYVWSLAYLIEASLLARRLEAKGVSHLHNHLGRNSAAVAMFASVLTGIPYSLTIHGPTEFEMAQSLALDEKMARANFTIGISSFGRSQLMRFSRASDWPRIHVVHCGLSDEFKQATPAPVPDVLRFVCVARFVEQKAHALLIEAVARLVEEGRDVHLDLIGDGPLRASIETTIVQHDLRDRVHLLGWQDSTAVRRAIESSRALVLPSFAEGLPVSIMEAMALARPVIGTYVGAIPELVENKTHGWLVPAGAIDELTEALRQALDTPVEILTCMGRAGRERVLQRHDAGREAQKLASLIMGGQR